MGLVKVIIPEQTEERFRKTAMERFGYGKGSLSKAAEEAFNFWAEDEEFVAEVHAIGNPVAAIQGMLKNVKKSSVELQHEIAEIRSEKYVRTRH
ncbi:hypothetical protein HYX13_02980 [Candidatus Woesearchaeota archaeon]|nr:hypothetical protein [Candidatus Woesearchaeota archaeon]